MKAYLIGYPLGYSYSPEIHRLFNEKIDYAEKPLKEEELGRFLSEKAFDGLNVTIPYKEKVLPFLDALDGAAREIGAVNTIVCRQKKLIGYNTDHLGVAKTFADHRIGIKGKTAMILGSGGTYRTIRYVLEKAGVQRIYGVSRNPKNDAWISYPEAMKKADVQILINATPVGTYPDTDQTPIRLNAFPRLECVFDMIYNPYRTALLLEAEERGIQAINGLKTLVDQAGYAEELFLSSPIGEEKYRSVYATVRRRNRSIVLIGMPGSGKSTVGALLAERLHTDFIDIDREIEKQCRLSVKEIFRRHGEAYFRRCEEAIAGQAALLKGKVIATGGGLVENDRIMSLFRQNGVLIALQREPDAALFGKDRPKLNGREDYLSLYERRKEKYDHYAVATVSNDGRLEETVAKVVEIDESADS